MGLLGDYVATIEANISDFTQKLDKADKHYQDFYKKQLDGEKKRLEVIKNLLEDELGVRVKNSQEVRKLTENMSPDIQKKLKKNTETVVSELKKQTDAVKAARDKLINWAAIGISIPVTIGIGKSVSDFADFQRELFNVKAVTGATNAEFRAMMSTAIEMSTLFKFTGKEIATAFLELGQAGYDASEILTSAKDVMVLASAGMKDIAFTSSLVVTSLKAFNLEADSSGRFVDVFARSAAKSVSSLDKISASLKYTAGLWGSQNWEIENLIGILDVLYDTGVRGEKAGRLLASAINGLNKPTASASETIKRLTGSTNALNPAMNDVTQIVKKLAAANATTADVFAIFGKEGTDIILRLIQNVEKLDEAIAEVTGKSGEAAKQANIQMQSLASQWDILKNKATAFSKEALNAIEPALVAIIKGIGGIFDFFNKMPDWTKSLAMLGVAFAALSPAVLKGLSALSGIAIKLGLIGTSGGLATVSLGAFALAAGGVGVAVAGVAAAYSVYKKNQDDWFESVNKNVEKLSSQGKDVEALVKNVRKLFELNKDSKEFKDAIWELSEAFPKLRREIVDGSGNMTTAMKVFNEEYAKFTSLTAKASKAEIDLATSDIDIQIARLKALNNEITAIENNLKLTNEEQSRLLKSFKEFGYVSENAKFEDVIKYLKDIGLKSENIGFLYKSFGGASFDKVRKFVLGLSSASNEAKILSMNIAELKRLMESLNPKPSESIKDNLLTEMNKTVSNISSKVGTIKIEAELTNTDGINEAVKSAGIEAQELLSKVLQDYKQELVFFEVIDKDGKETQRFDKYFKERYEKIQKLIKEKGVNFWEALKIEGGGITGIDDFISDIQQYSSIVNSVGGDVSKLSKEQQQMLSNMGEKTRDALGLLFGLVKTADEFGKKPPKGQLDWWEQLKKSIEDTTRLLKGFGDEGVGDYITSLTEKLRELESGTGDYENVKELGVVLQKAFDSDEYLNQYLKGLNIADSLIESIKIKLKEMGASTINFVGGDDSLLNYEIALEKIQLTINSNKTALENLNKTESGSAEKRKILSEQSGKLSEELLKLKLSFGLISQAEYDAGNATREFMKEVRNDSALNGYKEKLLNATKGLKEAESILSNLYRKLAEETDITVKAKIEIDIEEAKQNVIDFKSELDSIPLGDIYSLSKNMEDINIFNISDIGFAVDGIKKAKDELKRLKQQINDAKDGKIDIDINIAEAGVKVAKETIKNFTEQIAKGINSANEVIKSNASAVSSITKAWKSFNDGATTAGQAVITTVSSIGSLAGDVGAAISKIDPMTGAIVSIIGGVLESIPVIAEMFGEEFDKIQHEINLKIAENSAEIAKITQDNILDQDFKDLGSSVGDSIVSGILNGDSWENVEQEFRRKLFELAAQQLLTLTGFREILAAKVEALWDAMADGDQKKYIEMKKQNEARQKQIESYTQGFGIEAYEVYINNLKEVESEMSDKGKESKAQKKILQTQIETMQKQLETAKGIESAYKNVNEEMTALQDKDTFGQLKTEGEAFDEAMKDITETLEDAYESTKTLADGIGVLGEASKTLAKDLNKSLADAVLTGSFKDFKQAVYSKVTEAVTNALLESTLFKTKIDKIVKQILNIGDDFSQMDANSIIAEINKIWSDATDPASPLGKIIQSLRTGLSEFGEFDINVNPANVVTAIPADVQDKLVTSIKEVAENLSQAITEAGLNSHIDVVNIAMAQINQMIATEVIINSAVFDMSGNIVLQNIAGDDIATWLENAIIKYVEASTP